MSRKMVTCFVLLLLQARGSYQEGKVEYVNVALRKPTQQSGVWGSNKMPYGYSRLAVDGNRDPNYMHGSCTASLSSEKTYWIVDLLEPFTIHHINISNRDIVPERFQDFEIYVSDVDPVPIPPEEGESFAGELCLRHPGALPKEGPHSFECESNCKRGRYVYLYKPHYHGLHLCEFEVFVDTSCIGGCCWSPTAFSIRPGKKISKDPISSPRLEPRFSAMDCIAACVSAIGATVHVQMNPSSKTCECVVVNNNGLLSVVSEISDADWTLYIPG